MKNHCIMLLRIVESLLDIEHDFLAEKGLNLAKTRILHALEQSEQKRLPFADLQNLTTLKCSQPTFSRFMESLETTGFITVEKNESDARGKIAIITEKGSELCRECAQKMKEDEELLVKGLTKDEVTQLFTIIEKIYANIEE